MKVTVCPWFYESGHVEIIVDITLTKKDLEERTWSRYEKVVLTKSKDDKVLPCYEWKSDDHRDDDFLISFEYSEGYRYKMEMAKEEAKKIISVLESDKEWIESIEKLKKFAKELLEKMKKQ